MYFHFTGYGSPSSKCFSISFKCCFWHVQALFVSTEFESNFHPNIKQKLQLSSHETFHFWYQNQCTGNYFTSIIWKYTVSSANLFKSHQYAGPCNGIWIFYRLHKTIVMIVRSHQQVERPFPHNHSKLTLHQLKYKLNTEHESVVLHHSLNFKVLYKNADDPNP